MASPTTWLLEVDWDNSQSYDGGNEDITAQVVSVETFIGRNFPSQLTGNAVVGNLRAVLYDPDGTYARFNTSSTLYGSLLPNRKVQLSGTWNTATGTDTTVVWAGYLNTVTPRKGLGDRQEALLTASGPFKVLDTDINVTLQTSIRTDNAVDTLLDAVDWNLNDRVLATGKTTMRYWVVDGMNALNAARQIEATESGFLRETRDGKIQFNDRQYRQAGSFTTPQATYSDSATSTLQYDSIDAVDALRSIYNDFRAQVQPFSTGTSTVLWSNADANLTGTINLTPGGVMSIFASYPNPTSETNAWGVASWTTMSATADYRWSDSPTDTANRLDTQVAVTESTFSKSRKITFENTGTVTVYLKHMQARGQAILRGEAVTVSSTDSTSQDIYGVRRFPRPDAAQWVPDANEADNWTKYNVAIFKDPHPIVSVSFNPLKSTAIQNEVFVRDIDERVSVIATGTDISGANFGLNEDFYVEAIRHRVRMAGYQHNVSFDLSAAAGFSDFWVLGSSELGTQTRLNY